MDCVPLSPKQSASSCSNSLKEWLGCGLETDTDIELYHRVDRAMKQTALAKEVLKQLNLEELGLSARLRDTCFEVRPMWYCLRG
jgi:hypothetical protein